MSIKSFLLGAMTLLCPCLPCYSSTTFSDVTLEPIASFNSSIPGNPIFGDGYGQTVRLNGDWAFVAAPVARAGGKIISGAIYVYKREGNDYVQTQIIETDGTSDNIGSLQMESKGDWLLFSLIGTPAGAIPNDILINQNFTGSVQIYHLENGKWVLHSAIDRSTPGLQELSVIDPNALNPLVPFFLFEQGGNLGLNFSLNWEHKVLLITAQYQAALGPNNTVLINAGAVYAFHFDSRQKRWVLTQKITNPEGSFANDVFGANVVTDGHYALISNGPIFQQPKIFNTAVYVYKRSSCGQWKFIQKLTGDQRTQTVVTVLIPNQPPVQLPVGDAFGNTLDLKDGNALVGAPLENLDTTSVHGAVYFYRLDEENHRFRRIYKAVSTDPTSQGFGFPEVKLYKDNALISDINFSGPAGQSQGAIATYHFRDKCRGEWRFTGNLLDPNADAFNYFGESFDIQKDRLAVGQGLFAGGFFFGGVGTPPIVPPLPYAPRPFTIFRIVK